MSKLAGKVAVVTGASKGIGASIAEHFGAAGASVVVNYSSSKAGADAVVKKIIAKGGKAIAVQGDVSKQEDIVRLFAETRKAYGKLDILVNNAGIQFVAAVEEFPEAKWEQIIAINLSAVFYGMKAAIPGMKAKGWGRIINIASAHGLVGSPHKVAYVAAKHGVVGATKVAAIELANDGITVNAICPGWVLTPLVEHQLEDRAKEAGTDVPTEEKKMLQETQPMLKFSTPEHIGGLVVFLCSAAAETITGVPLPIDGGWVAH